MEAQRTILLIISLSLLLATNGLANSSTTKPGSTFIGALCRGTTYPNLCSDTLLQYSAAVGSNHWKLCNRALWVTFQAARNSSVLVYGLSKQRALSMIEADVVSVCVENVLDGADRIRQSMRAMGVGQLKRSNFDWQISNVKTWMSAAITDMVTCTDAFDGLTVNAGMKSKVTDSVDKVEKLTSNALSLINRLSW